jgi:RNA polymerase sigma-70 factor (sigma-E family)
VNVGSDHLTGQICASNGASSSRVDDPEFHDYVAARGRALLRTAYLLTGNLADAEDLVQAALAKTYLAWDRIVDRGALDGYVRRAIVNTHISWWRRRRVQEFPTDDLPDQAVADHAGDSDLQETVRRAIDRLPQRMRAVLVLRYYEDMTEAEVAERLGVSLGTVKSTVSRAVAKLRIDAELLADLAAASRPRALLTRPENAATVTLATANSGTVRAASPARAAWRAVCQEVRHARHDDGYSADHYRDPALRDDGLP